MAEGLSSRHDEALIVLPTIPIAPPPIDIPDIEPAIGSGDGPMAPLTTA